MVEQEPRKNKGRIFQEQFIEHSLSSVTYFIKYYKVYSDIVDCLLIEKFIIRNVGGDIIKKKKTTHGDCNEVTIYLDENNRVSKYEITHKYAPSFDVVFSYSGPWVSTVQ